MKEDNTGPKGFNGDNEKCGTSSPRNSFFLPNFRYVICILSDSSVCVF